MLFTHLIGMPKEVIRLVATKPREGNQKRITAVQKFFADPNAGQLLRRSSLALQLSGGLEALTCKKPKQGERPTIVGLVEGAADDLVQTRLRRLFGAMPGDSTLELGPAMGVLLGAAADLLVRFAAFKLYPFKICELSRVWFPDTWQRASLDFLHEPEPSLDVGLSFVLQRLSWERRSEEQALAWLMSGPIQGFILQVGKESLSSSI